MRRGRAFALPFLFNNESSEFMKTKSMKRLLIITAGLVYVFAFAAYLTGKSVGIEEQSNHVVPLPPSVTVAPVPENVNTQTTDKVFEGFDRVIKDRLAEEQKEIIYTTSNLGKKFVCTKDAYGVIEAWFFKTGSDFNSNDLLPADQFEGSGPNPAEYCERMFDKE
jgi:hypothetical protein